MKIEQSKVETIEFVPETVPTPFDVQDKFMYGKSVEKLEYGLETTPMKYAGITQSGTQSVSNNSQTTIT